ncbi:hypothetical protein HY792_03310 [Candidatus Desantisbacteria bacterium]|nr:hypothetical protein [Candidatus Desantisbacteria bacterium]
MWQLISRVIMVNMVAMIVCSGCTLQKPKEVAVLPPQILPEPLKEKPIIPQYIYQNANSRDPFVSLIVDSGQMVQEQKGKIPTVDITELALIGIVWDKKDTIALVRGPGGNTFILRYGILFYGDYPITGVRGKVLNQKCISLFQIDKIVTIGLDASDTKVAIRGMNIPVKQEHLLSKEDLSKPEKQEIMKAFASGFGEGLAKEAVKQQGK